MDKEVVEVKKRVSFRGISQIGIGRELRRACLTVSLGQQKEQGKKLQAIIEKANQSFASLDIMLCDSLNRFNLMVEQSLSLAEAEDVSIKMGDQWLNDNEVFLQSLQIPGSVIRWNEWRLSPDLSSVINELVQLIERDAECAQVFKSVATEYFSRKALDASAQDMDLALQYLIEECAVMRLWAKHGYNIELYPAPRNRAVTYYFNSIFKNSSESYLHYLPIEFKKLMR